MAYIHLRQAQSDTKNTMKKVRFELTSGSEDYVFVDRIPMTRSAVERLAAEYYSKLHPCWLEPYGVVSFGLKVV